MTSEDTAVVAAASMGSIRKEPPWAPPPLLSMSSGSCSSSLQKRFSRFRSCRAGVFTSQSTMKKGNTHCAVLVESRNSRAFEDEGFFVPTKQPIAASVAAGSPDVVLRLASVDVSNFEGAVPSETTDQRMASVPVLVTDSVPSNGLLNSAEVLTAHGYSRVDGANVSERSVRISADIPRNADEEQRPSDMVEQSAATEIKLDEGSVRILGAADIPSNADEGKMPCDMGEQSAKGVTENKVDEGSVSTAHIPSNAAEDQMSMLCDSDMVNRSATESKVDDLEEGELEEANKADDDDMEEGQLPCELEEADDDDMEEGQLPCELEEASTAERPSESKVSLYPFDFVNAAVFESPVREPEFTLADWHAHLSTGKPLEAQKVSNSKKRKRKEGPNAKKKKKENRLQQMQEKKKTEFKAVSNNTEGKIASGNSPKNCDQNSSKEQATPEAEIAPQAENKWSLSTLVEKQLGIWKDPEENAESKKNKRSHKRPMSAERKQKKKAHERKKRAEKERQLGIIRRRPIIHTPVVKPPTICKYFMKGRCSKGEACTFSHEATPETKLELCKFFLNRCCLKGDDCPYSHDTLNFPCKYYITRGFCNDGDECRFSHEPVSKEEYVKLLQRLEKKEPPEQDAKTGAEAKGNDPKPEGTAWLGEPDRYSPMRETEEPVDYDPIPRGSWWNSDASYSPLEEPAATMAPKSPEYDPMPQGCWWNSAPYAEADNPLLKAAKQAAAEAKLASARPRATPPVSSTCAPSVMDLLQQSLKESGDVFY